MTTRSFTATALGFVPFPTSQLDCLVVLLGVLLGGILFLLLQY